MRTLLLQLCLLLACGSCAPKPRESGKQVIDINGILDLQLDQLGRRRPMLNKEAAVNNTQSDTTFVPDPNAWKSELEVFRSLGMVNQRIYADRYRAEGPLDDPQSNLMILHYSNEEAPLHWIRLYYHDAPERVRKIEGEVREDTPMYASCRKLSLWFEDDRGQLLISRYEVTGYQKAALRDTVHFRVFGSVQW